MKRTLEICASFTGTIPTGQFENEKPFYSVKESMEIPEGEVVGDDYIEVRTQHLHDICYSQFKKQADASYSEMIAKKYKEIRWYPGLDGLLYPSVTSVTSLDKDFHIPYDELMQRAARGTCIHKQGEIFALTGEWKEIKDIPEVSTEYKTVKQGSLGLVFDDVDLRGFLKDYPVKIIECEKVVTNHEYRYAGRMDFLCIIESANKGKWAKIDGVIYDEPTILDMKTGTSLDKDSGLTQQAAYAKAEGVKQIGLIHLTNKNACGYAKPVITSNVERFWDLFYKKLQVLNERYGL